MKSVYNIVKNLNKERISWEIEIEKFFKSDTL